MKRNTYHYDPTIVSAGAAEPGDTWHREVIAALSYNPEGDIHHAIDWADFIDALSPRQKEIIRLLDDGYTQTEIAEKLGISQPTVSRELSIIQRLYDAFFMEDKNDA